MTVYLLAHGSVDPRHAEDVARIAARLGSRLGTDVRPCYLDHCRPGLADVADVPGIVVPLLFSPGYHVQVDVRDAVAQAAVPLVTARPPLLTSGAAWGSALLAEVAVAWPGRDAVMVTAGTRDNGVLAQWDRTAETLGVPVRHAGGPGSRLAARAVSPDSVVVPLLVARGHFSDLIDRQARGQGLPTAACAGASDALLAELAQVVGEASAPARSARIGMMS